MQITVISKKPILGNFSERVKPLIKQIHFLKKACVTYIEVNNWCKEHFTNKLVFAYVNKA